MICMAGTELNCSHYHMDEMKMNQIIKISQHQLKQDPKLSTQGGYFV